MMRRTKIVATLGPASSEERVLSRMIAAGMDVARLNVSHGKLEEHRKRIRLIRRLARQQNRAVAVMLDLQGPKIRIGTFKNNGPVQLIRGKHIYLTDRPVVGDAQLVYVTYSHLYRDLKVGDPVLFDDGRIRLEVVGKRNNQVECRVLQGGWLKEKKGVNLPQTAIRQKTITAKDLQDLELALDEGVDYLALSFVRRASDVEQLRKILKKHKKRIPIVSKIERAESLQNLDEILSVSDGIMVARGDLGVEVSFEKVPILQKEIIRKANAAGVPVITATQMLESMIANPNPTRAEVSDVANAIFDGTDAVMLSGETASGIYPVEAIRMMGKIAEEAETSFNYAVHLGHAHQVLSVPHAVVHAACHAAEEVRAQAILVFTMTGKTAIMLSKLKPARPIYVFVENETVFQQMALLWGVTPLKIRAAPNTDEMIHLGEKSVLKKRLLKRGDCMVVVAGTTHLRGATNMVKVLRL